jgi:pimeloyl-ACP methyl ester carboxylesterase
MEIGNWVPHNFGEAEERLRAASFAAWALVAMNVVATFIVDDAMYQLADAVFVLMLAVGISLRSRWGLIAMTLYYVLSTVIVLAEGGIGGVIFKVFIIGFFARATIAAFKFHEWKPAEAKWLPIARILFIIASVLVPLLAIVAMFVVAVADEMENLGGEYPAAEEITLQSTSLKDARAGWSTKVAPRAGRVREPISTPPEGSGLTKVSFPSSAGALAGYLSVAPAAHEGQKVPAIVWAVGGFDGIGDWVWTPADASNDQSVLPMLGQGVVIFAPSWRGQGDNPGEMELFYGEVEDLLAAVAFIKKDPRVDPDRVWIAGHSTGGTLTLLAAELGSGIRGAVALGPWPDMAYTHRSDPLGMIPWPYDEVDGREDELRSPVQYLTSVSDPTLVVMAQGDVSADVDVFKTLADRHNPKLSVIYVEGDHFNTVRPVQQALVEIVKADIGQGILEIPTEPLLRRTRGLHWDRPALEE